MNQPQYVLVLNIPEHRMAEAFREVYNDEHEIQYSFSLALVEGLLHALQQIGHAHASDFMQKYQQAIGIRFETADLYEDGRIVAQLVDASQHKLHYLRFHFEDEDTASREMYETLSELKKALIEAESYELLASLRHTLP